MDDYQSCCGQLSTILWTIIDHFVDIYRWFCGQLSMILWTIIDDLWTIIDDFVDNYRWRKLSMTKIFLYVMTTKISDLSIANPLQHFYKVKMIVSEKISTCLISFLSSIYLGLLFSLLPWAVMNTPKYTKQKWKPSRES